MSDLGSAMQAHIDSMLAGPSWRDSLARVPWDRFCTVSLFNWLEAAKAASLPFVPATEIWRGPIASLLQFDQEGPGQADITAMNQAIDAASALHQIMLRWDCCAGYDVKGRIGNGKPEWHESFASLQIDDPRAFDLLYEYPRDDMIIWSRPWIKAARHENYPVEFRVFVKDGAVLGVSNYYPQMALSEAYRGFAELACKKTEELIAKIACPVWVPHDGRAGRWAPDKVHGTVDWLLTQDETLLLLEGGPPFGAGAHPCCFIERDTIAGVALSADIPKDELY